MTRRARLNLLLAATALALCAASYFGSPPPPAGGPLTTVDPDRIDRIVLARDSAAELRFERRAGRWWLDGSLPANADRVQAMLRLLQESAGAPLTGDGIDLHRLEIEPPNVMLRLGAEDFAFGTTSPIDGRRYVRHAGHVYRLPDNLYAQLRQPREFFVEHRLLVWDGRLASIEYDDQRFVLDTGGWRADPPGDWAADGIARLAHAWESAQALEVMAQAGAAPGAAVVLGNDHGARIELRLALPVGNTLLRPELGLRYELDPGSAKRLLLAVDGRATPPAAD